MAHFSFSLRSLRNRRLQHGRRFVLLRRACVSKCGALFETLLRGPIQWCVEIFEGDHGVMIEIGDVTKRGPKC